MEKQRIVRLVLSRPVGPSLDVSGKTDLWTVPVTLGDMQDLMGVEKLWACVKTVTPVARTVTSTGPNPPPAPPPVPSVTVDSTNDTFILIGTARQAVVTVPHAAYTTPAALIAAVNPLLIFAVGTNGGVINTSGASTYQFSWVNNTFSFVQTLGNPDFFAVGLEFNVVSSAAPVFGFDPVFYTVGPGVTAIAPHRTFLTLGQTLTAVLQLPTALKVEVSELPQDGFDSGLRGPSRTVAYLEPLLVDPIQFPYLAVYTQGNIGYDAFTVNRAAINNSFWSVRVSDLSGNPVAVPLGFVYEVCISLSF